MRGNVKTVADKPAEEIITRLALHIDYFNKYSHPHSVQMADLAARLASRLGLVRTDTDAIIEAALLHDIGLYEMAPPYLSNPGPLSQEQRMDLWRHSIIGEQAMARRGASRHSQLLVRWHHEWWNGNGYPDMLCFEEIPIGARVLHTVEIYCALIANRPYRPALSRDHALDALRASAGVQTDPFVIRELLGLLQRKAPEISPITGIAHEPPPTEPLGVLAAPVQQPTAALEPGPAEETTGALEATPAAQSAATDAFWPAEPSQAQPGPAAAIIQSQAPEASGADHNQSDGVLSRGWNPSPYMSGSLLGFQVSVLR